MIPTKQKLKLDLLGKYSVNIPRYTSYPTAPEWSDNFSKEELLKEIEEGNKKLTPISLYFHLPFCESHCYFCACNVVISKNKEIVIPYLNYLKKEISLISKFLKKGRIVEQIHLGGGTPTYFAPSELTSLFNEIEGTFNISRNCEISAEIDPRVTTYDHLETLSNLGFNRLSMGIQDFDFSVQEAINRVQTFEDTRDLMWHAREFGFQSINVDLVYGLPHQNKNSFSKTIDLVLELEPDRIALFHYAHLPQLLAHQAKYITDSLLPTSTEKIEIFNHAVEILTDCGYVFIGLDHFASPSDELTLARKNKTLHRNFQGYTTKAGCDLFGFGITGISSTQNAYWQNIKKLNPYYEAMDKNNLPFFRGILLNKDDIIRKEIIMKLLCHGEVTTSEIEEKYNIIFESYFSDGLEKLEELIKDGIVIYSNQCIAVTDIGQFFLRNIASVFDYYLQIKNGEQRVYSKTI